MEPLGLPGVYIPLLETVTLTAYLQKTVNSQLEICPHFQDGFDVD